MNDFLYELELLLEKHKASIIRSADENSKLVVAVFDEESSEFIHTEFTEDISSTAIALEWYEFV